MTEELRLGIALLNAKLDRMTFGPIQFGWVTVYCNRRCEGALWYTVRNGDQVPFTASALRGVIDAAEIASKEYKGKTENKLRLTLDCGDTFYILEAGVETQFAESLCYAIASIPRAELRNPVIIQPDPGEDPAVLFAKVRSPGRKLVSTKAAREQMTAAQAIEKTVALVGNSGNGQPTAPVELGDRSVPPPATKSAPTHDLSDLIARTDIEMRRVGISPEQGRAILLQMFNKRSRQALSEGEMSQFLEHLGTFETRAG